MTAQEIVDLVVDRHAAASELLELTHQQWTAIRAGRMNELMHLLARKQKPLQSLGELSRRLRSVMEDPCDPPHWDSSLLRTHCHDRHTECQAMLDETMKLEMQCESHLVASRSEIQSQITQFDGRRQANETYRQSQVLADRGGSLDLSSG